MAKGFLSPVVEKLLDKLGTASGLVPMALGFLKIKLAAGDAEGARGRVNEMREYHVAGLTFCDKADAALLDNALEGPEVVALLESLDILADEAQDIFTGEDEDDV